MPRENLAQRNNSNIAPIARMGKPVKSKASRYAALMPDNDTRIGYLKNGNLVSAFTSGTKGYLGFKGARQDYEAERAYNEYLARLAEQERIDRLAQQQIENDYRERQLLQQAELKQKELDAIAERARVAREQQIADRDAQWKHEKSIYDRNRADAVADRDVQLQAAIDAEKRKRAYEEEQLVVKQLDPASQKKYYELKAKGINPVVVDNEVGTLGKIVGTPKYSVYEKQQEAVEAPQLPSLGFGSLLNYGKQLQTFRNQVGKAQPKETKKTQVINGYTIIEE